MNTDRKQKQRCKDHCVTDNSPNINQNLFILSILNPIYTYQLQINNNEDGFFLNYILDAWHR